MAIYAIGLAVRTIMGCWNWKGWKKIAAWHSDWQTRRVYIRATRRIAKARGKQRGAVNPRILAGLLMAAAAVAGGLAANEGRKYHAYRDGIGAGAPWTICEGHTRGVREGDTASPALCDKYKAEDLAYAARSIASCLRVELPPNQLAAYLDLEFNTGKFCGSSMERRANEGDQRGACASIGLYVYAAGKDCRLAASNCAGIVKRRAQEMALCWPDFGNVQSGVLTA
jgi:lysozyme